MNKTQFIKDLKEKDSIESPFLIKFSATAVGKNGKPYMNLIFMDKSGEIEGRVWEDVTNYVGQAVKDTFVWVNGRCQSYQGRRQIVVQSLQILREDEVNVKDFVPASELDADALYSKLMEYVSSMQD